MGMGVPLDLGATVWYFSNLSAVLGLVIHAVQGAPPTVCRLARANTNFHVLQELPCACCGHRNAYSHLYAPVCEAPEEGDVLRHARGSALRSGTAFLYRLLLPPSAFISRRARYSRLPLILNPQF